MAKDTESDEEQIWNYNLTRPQHSRKMLHRENVSESRTRRSRKEKSVVPVNGTKKTDSVVVTEVIDVDLLDENEFDVPKVSVAMSRKVFSGMKYGSSEHTPGAKTLSASSVKGFKLEDKKSPIKTSRDTKIARKTRTSKSQRSKTRTSKSQRSKTGSALSCQDKSESLHCPDIHKYFSPTQDRKQKKRKSSEFVDGLHDFTDKKLIVLVSKTEARVNNKSCNSQTDKKYVSCGPETLEFSDVGGSLNKNVVSREETESSYLKNVSESVKNQPGVLEKADKSDVDNKTSLTFGDLNELVDSKSENDSCECDKQVISDTLECGFLVPEHPCDLGCSIDDYTLRDACELQVSTSSNQSSGNTEFSESSGQVPSLASPSAESSDILYDGAEVTEKNHSLNTRSNLVYSSSSKSEDALSLDQHLPTTARKQTSINSYFKPKFGSVCKASQFFSSKHKVSSHLPHAESLPNCPSKVAARPDLYRRKTVASVSPSLSSRISQKQFLRKSASEVSGGHLSCVEKQQQLQDGTKDKRQCPFYKWISGTKITVDAFSYGVIPGCEAYILTHFHSDHYGGLGRRFAQPLYCSQVTGNLVAQKLGVDRKWINPLPLWKPCQVAGVTITFMEANHCPGSVIVLFELSNGKKVLHTGDFRACPDMEEYPMLKGVSLSELYLDTTYCDPSRTFPSQSEVISFAVSLVQKYVMENPKTLIVCGTYTIGKEKIFTAIAKAINSKICVTSEKKRVLDCLDDAELQSMITTDFSDHQVHVLPMFKLSQKALYEHHSHYPQFQQVLAFKPTGWTHSEKKASLENLRPEWSRNGVTLFGVPYSEHSSFLELKRFVQFLQPRRIIPTVNNGSHVSRKKMEDIFAQWMREVSTVPKTLAVSPPQQNLNSWLS